MVNIKEIKDVIKKGDEVKIKITGNLQYEKNMKIDNVKEDENYIWICGEEILKINKHQIMKTNHNGNSVKLYLDSQLEVEIIKIQK